MEEMFLKIRKTCSQLKGKLFSDFHTVFLSYSTILKPALLLLNLGILFSKFCGKLLKDLAPGAAPLQRDSSLSGPQFPNSRVSVIIAALLLSPTYTIPKNSITITIKIILALLK